MEFPPVFFFLLKGFSSVLQSLQSCPELLGYALQKEKSNYSVFKIDHLCWFCMPAAFLPSDFPLELGYCAKTSPMGKVIYIMRKRVKLMSVLLVSVTLLKQLCFATPVTTKYWTGSWVYQARSWMSNYHHLSDDPYSDWNHFTPSYLHFTQMWLNFAVENYSYEKRKM